MNRAILFKEVQEFIAVNLRTDINALILKPTVFEEVSNKELAEQIQSKIKAQSKLPTWFVSKNIYFPPKLSIEQTSSEQTARYKSSLIKGKRLIDLTGGFGVDDFYFSKQFDEIFHCEVNENLSQISQHNFSQLGVDNCIFFAKNGLEYLKDVDQNFDWIYVDPSRRDDAKGKVFLMEDCLPDIPNNLDLLFSRGERIMMKTSPLIDLSKGLSELKFVKEIHVVALKNEVKELLWILEKNYTGEVEIKTVNLNENKNEVLNFLMSSETIDPCLLSMPQHYLYEPNSAILKSGGFNQVGIQNNVFKLHKHSHLYTSSKLLKFPGRRFLVQEVVPASGKELKKLVRGMKANVTTRNYPQSVDSIRKSLKIRGGGDVFLFFTTNQLDKRVCLVCSKA